MSTELAGQVAVISGGLGDIGAATALELGRHGADIAVCDVRHEKHAAELQAELSALHRRSRYDRVDVADPVAVESWLDAVAADLGLPTIVVPCAAVVNVRRIPAITSTDWRHELSINLDGPFYLANSAARRLIEHGRSGRIVFVGSWAADHVHLEMPTYCIAKAGVRMLMKCMAGALASRGVLVNEISPGFVDGGLAGPFMAADPSVREQSRKQVPTGELLQPVEVGRAIAQLCDPGNRHMTGSTLLVDGGLSLFGTAILNSD